VVFRQQSDFEQYLSEESSFGFELECVRAIRDLSKSHMVLNYDITHGGTYVDPNTGKTRQYDVQATLVQGNIVLACAIECKRLDKSFPLLVSCVDESHPEGQIDIIRKLNGTRDIYSYRKTFRRASSP
jgi:hypothetical protein